MSHSSSCSPGSPMNPRDELPLRIDELVYRLYGLTDKEIRTVEEATVG